MTFEIDLPFTDHDELELGRAGDELLVRVGPYRRAVVLPDALRRRVVAGAKLDDGRLAVTFADPPPAHDRDRNGGGTETSGAGRAGRAEPVAAADAVT